MSESKLLGQVVAQSACRGGPGEGSEICVVLEVRVFRPIWNHHWFVERKGSYAALKFGKKRLAENLAPKSLFSRDQTFLSLPDSQRDMCTLNHHPEPSS